MQRRSWQTWLALSELIFAHAELARDDDRPNILLVVVDDLGYSDLHCYGGEIETPHLDQLAARGIRFTQFYNCSRCCQTRASLLTGAYPQRIGMAEFGRTMNLEVPTLAENLRDSGYQTALVGKWHLSELPQTQSEQERIEWMNHERELDQPFADLRSYPTRRGFQKFYGIVWGVVNHFDPFSLTDEELPVRDVPSDYYFTDAISDRSAEYIREFAQGEKPFFMYVAYTAPHWPIQALPADIEKYRGKFDQGWQELRRARFERQQQSGLFDKSVALGDQSGGLRDWKGVPANERAYLAAKMEVHAAMVDRVDQGFGKIVSNLRTAGELDNTIIFFFSDNGASPEIPAGPGYDRYSATRDGRRALRDRELRRTENRSKLGSEESYTGIGPAWASAVNTPLRYWKAESYDGGCRTPMIVAWPDGLKSKLGTLVTDIGHVIDLSPTCLALANATPRSGTLQDGISLAPLMSGQSLAEDRALYFEHGDGRGIRRQKWKASKLAGKEWELFDLERDPGETKNLAVAHPTVLQSLVNDWEEWSESVTSASQQ